jgi:hypothetical protein
LLIPILFSGALLAMPVKDTVWWNTPGGRVTEHRDATNAVCSLMLYNDAGSVTFEWEDPGRTLVTAINWNWQVPDNWNVPLALQIGDAWLSNGRDSAVIQAVGHGNAVAFTTEQPVDDLLRPADHIAVRTGEGEMSIKLRPDKVRVLLAQTAACRRVIKR